jgi:hypothetical protein
LREALFVDYIDDSEAVADIALAVDAHALIGNQIGDGAGTRLTVKDDIWLAVALGDENLVEVRDDLARFLSG